LESINSSKNENILKIHEYIVDENEDKFIIYLVLPYSDSGNLVNYLETMKEKITEEQILDILIQIIEAVGSYHKNEVAIEDLNPENIYVYDDEKGKKKIKILNCGFSQNNSQTMIYYKSPELYADGDVNISSDIYSYGGVIYYLMTKNHIDFKLKKNREEMFNSLLNVSFKYKKYFIKLIEMCCHDEKNSRINSKKIVTFLKFLREKFDEKEEVIENQFIKLFEENDVLLTVGGFLNSLNLLKYLNIFTKQGLNLSHLVQFGLNDISGIPKPQKEKMSSELFKLRDDLKRWLYSINFPQYLRNFKKNGVKKISDLIQLDKKELNEMGFKKYGIDSIEIRTRISYEAKLLKCLTECECLKWESV